ncbi:MAG: HK97 family phage prohead protease [Hydrogenibacillus schlegelii]|nr:HK97 family phage prohead protease [Hydrogenibacillus schlegelii]
MKVERRAVQSDVSVDDDGLVVEGYAAVYDRPTVIGDFEEVIAPGAFGGADFRDAVFLVDHGGLPLATARAWTLDLNPDATGLRVVARLAPVTAARDLVTLIKRGDITGMSFAFSDVTDEWVGRRRVIRKIGKVWDVSAVTWPAYRETVIVARSLAMSYNSLRKSQTRIKLI